MARVERSIKRVNAGHHQVIAVTIKSQPREGIVGGTWSFTSVYGKAKR